jgi:hypothetical protein
MCVISRDHESSSEFSEHCAGRVIYQTAVGWQDVNGKNIERSGISGFSRSRGGEVEL